MGSDLHHEEKKYKERMDALIYNRQYYRKIPFTYTVFTKVGFFFFAYMLYAIYAEIFPTVVSYAVLILGIIFIYRNIVKDKFHERDTLYVFKKVGDLLSFLSQRGKERYYRYQSKKSNDGGKRVGGGSKQVNRFIKTYGTKKEEAA